MLSKASVDAPDDQGANPLVSVVIPTYNRGSFLERSVRSVLGQTYRNIECIVVDGASKDNSVELLEKLRSVDDRLRYVSETDSGEVEAVNKGIELARGEIIGWQASDDYYTPIAVENSVAFLVKHREFIGVAGDGLYVDEHGNPLGRGVITYRGKMDKNSIKRLIVERYKMCPVCHGSFFGWRIRLQRHGKFDSSFSVTPDWEFYLRVLSGGEMIGCIPEVHYKYTIHPDMGAVKYSERVEAQREKLYTKYGISAGDRLARATIGRLKSYLANPYRTPFLKGAMRELKEAWNYWRVPKRVN